MNVSTHAFYIFSSAFSGAGSRELGDIQVVPSNPHRTVVIGNVDSGHIGIQRLNSCGNIMTPTFGVFPSQLPMPWPPISIGGMNNRGLAFEAASGKAISPGMITNYFDGSGPFQTLFTFGSNGGAQPIAAASGELVDSHVAGAVASDEFGTLYLGESFGDDLGRLNPAVAPALSTRFPSTGAAGIWDVVHDANGHVFVAEDSSGFGRVRRVDSFTGVSVVWADNRGSFGGGGLLGGLRGVTIDASGDLWVVERLADGSHALVKVSGATANQVLDYVPIPQLVGGQGATFANPQGIAVYGVNLPAIREACSSSCATGQITDCFGNCVWADQLGDQFCDDGPHESLNCWGRNFDRGDCNFCSPGEVPDCNGNCGPLAWVGDSICDEGGPISQYAGIFLNYDCAEFRHDEATCLGCGWGEVLDCNGNCSPESWFGDSICDDGDWTYLGHPVDWDCVEYDFDQHTCN